MYACIALSKERADLVSQISLGDLTGAPVLQGSRISISSELVEIEFGDLGEAIYEYCSSLTLPDLRSYASDLFAYVQVVPMLGPADDSRVFLCPELLSLLAEKGFGLDIHGQDSI
jgi:hypothetical protein